MESKKTGFGAEEKNPKLEMAAKEIKDILEKYDVAGVVQMFIPGFHKYTMNINPSFSCVSVNDVGQLKMHPPIQVDPDDDKPVKQKISDTVNMLANLRLHGGKLTMVLTQAEMATRQYFGIANPKPPAGPNIHIPKNGKHKF